MKLPEVHPTDLRQALAANKQFTTVLAVLLLVLAAFPGSPARSLLDDIVGGGPAPVSLSSPVSTEAPGTGLDLPAPDLVPTGAIDAVPPPADAAPPAPPALIDPSLLPPADPLPPPPVCSTDAVADMLDQVRAPLGDLLGAPAPGAAIRKLAAISAGCSEDDPTGPLLDLALELGPLVPDTGIDVIDLPDLPGIDLPVPPELVDVLAPLAPGIREGCANLATVAVLFVVLPPAFNLPFSQSDLIQLVGPATSICALFDESAP